MDRWMDVSKRRRGFITRSISIVEKGGRGGRKSWLDSGECSVGGIGTSTLRVKSRFLYSVIHSFIHSFIRDLP